MPEKPMSEERPKPCSDPPGDRASRARLPLGPAAGLRLRGAGPRRLRRRSPVCRPAPGAERLAGGARGDPRPHGPLHRRDTGWRPPRASKASAPTTAAPQGRAWRGRALHPPLRRTSLGRASFPASSWARPCGWAAACACRRPGAGHDRQAPSRRIRRDRRPRAAPPLRSPARRMRGLDPVRGPLTGDR